MWEESQILKKNFVKILKSLSILEARHKRISESREIRKLRELKLQTIEPTRDIKTPEDEDLDTQEFEEIILR